MSNFYTLNLPLKASFVLLLVDSFTGKAPLPKSCAVYIEHLPYKPVVKANGAYVFSNLAKRSYLVRIQSGIYFETSVEVEVGEETTIIPLNLLPRPNYPFGNGSTLIRASVQTEEGQIAQDIGVQVDIFTAQCALGRLAKEVQAGSKTLPLFRLTSNLAVGDQVWLVHATDEQQRQLVEVADLDAQEQSIRLAQALKENFARHSLLFPVIKSKSDERGELVIPFRFYQSKTFTATLTFAYQNKHYLKEVRIEEGKVHYLGTVHV